MCFFNFDVTDTVRIYICGADMPTSDFGLHDSRNEGILTTNLAAVVCVCVCVCAKFDQFLPASSHFKSKRSENFVRI